jgi:hypothetical protein
MGGACHAGHATASGGELKRSWACVTILTMVACDASTDDHLAELVQYGGVLELLEDAVEHVR